MKYRCVKSSFWNIVFYCFLLQFQGISSKGIKRERWSPSFYSLKSSTPETIQSNAVMEMLKRLLPNHRQMFHIKVVSNHGLAQRDSFKISSPMFANDSRVEVIGSSGVAAASGVMHYLKFFCHCHVSWEASQLHLPSPLPSCYVKKTALDLFRYYQNVCTSSYSFAWWKWEDWERHIDWMALNGINLPLAFTAQEAIWRRVYLRFNFTEDDLNDYFAGPAFLAWNRMGNINKWGGPLSLSWHKQTLQLQHKILTRMREFGMLPVLPAFSGHVPSAIIRIFPNAEVFRLPAWGKFTDDNFTRTYFLSPKSPLFSQIGSEFIKEMQKEFNGTDHIYNCDPFNEMNPLNNSDEYLESVSKSIIKAMLQSDEKAVWVLQGWMFHSSFWTYRAAKAFLTAIPHGRLIVLDLDAEVAPLYAYFDSFFGHPFVFCLLSNYGGVNGLFGNFQILSSNLNKARNYSGSSLVGIGLTPEGINQNYVVYDFMLDLGWVHPKDVDIFTWVSKYAARRYGNSSENIEFAWKLLIRSVYNCTIPLRYHGQGVLIQHRPNLSSQPNLWYDPNDVIQSWNLMVKEIPKDEVPYLATDSNLTMTYVKDLNQTNYIYDPAIITPLWLQETFKHDLVDITRQVLQILGDAFILEMRQHYLSASINELNDTGNHLEELLDDLDYLLGTSEEFLLASWLTSASRWAQNQEEAYQYMTNALYQISLWGPSGEIVDYAVKQWNGVVGHYMKPRWMLFKIILMRCLKHGIPFVQEDFNRLVFRAVERPFAQGRFFQNLAPPTGNVLEVVRELHLKYTRRLQRIEQRSFDLTEVNASPAWI